MKPYLLFIGFSFFLFCLGLHILIWRLGRPKRHALALLGTFFAPLPILIPVLSFIWNDLSWADFAAVALLHAALSCAYIQVYPASQADSPSFKILLLVRKSMPAGMTQREIRAIFNSKVLLEDRLQDLTHAGLIKEYESNLELTQKGHALILPFMILRRLIGLPMGKG